MSVDFISDDTQIKIPSNQGLTVFSHEILLPTSISLIFYGKDQYKDTEIDESGTIIKDKAVIVKSMSLDGFFISELAFDHWLKLETKSECISGAYVGFNGSMKINFSKSNVFYQIMELDRLTKSIVG